MSRRAVRVAYAALSGLLLAAAFPPFSAWPAAFLGLVPLLRAVRDAADAKEAADLGGLAGFVFAAAALPWLYGVFSGWTVGLWCLLGLGPGLHAFLMKHLQRSRPEADALWVAAAGVLWTGFEAARAHLPGLATPWLSLGFSLASCPPLLQGASLVGVYGLSALLAASGAALALACEGRRMPALVLSGAVGLAWALGERRLERPEDGVPVTVALVQQESYDLERLAASTRLSEALAADLVVWPEYQVGVPAGHEDAYARHLARSTQGRRGVLVAGAATVSDDPKAPFENFAWVLARDGALLGRYDKAHPIPLMERRLKGHSDPRPVATPLGPLGVQICYDLDFEDGARRLAERGARILAVPNPDPSSWGPAQHAQHARRW
ncbi:MAG: hypothetical protein HYV15_00245 [Elusimicrobia bacterium]|nr:hypothetical protein [Elusimicrobiota bacterium]